MVAAMLKHQLGQQFGVTMASAGLGRARRADRLSGNDRRHAVDADKVCMELNWTPAETVEYGIRKTVQKNLCNQPWLANVASGANREWVGKYYGEQ